VKVLLIGDWHSDLHEQAVFEALCKLGHEVVAFPWFQYFLPCAGRLSWLDSILKRAQNKYLMGPLLSRINREVLAVAAREQPDLVFVYRGTHILSSTLLRIRKASPHAVIIGYNNDDPFAPNQFHRLFKHFLNGIPSYDLLLAYRHHNLDDFRHAGAKRVHLMRSWFIPERNFPVDLDEDGVDDYGCEVVFVGHYEDDGRLELLEEIVRRGWKLRLFGPGYDWDPVIRHSSELSSLLPVKLVWGAEYNKAICGAKIALCFLSKLNRDTYTRRCFEIPATKTMMLSEYSCDLASLYSEGEEAEFFRNKDEFLSKIEYYLANDAHREEVAAGGWRRAYADGHDVNSRMCEMIEQVENIRIGR
jgi:spore maturation protein CgeB